MLIKKTAAGLAVGAALALFMSAGAAQAGGASAGAVVVSPNPSTVGQSVNLSYTVPSPSCGGAMVAFSDVTAAPVALCSNSPMVADGVSSTATCAAALNTAGTRTIQANVSAGPCIGYFNTQSQIVNAAPAAVPTVGEWTMWGLTGLLLIGGGVFASRRFRTTAA